MPGKCYMEQGCNLTSRLKKEIEISLHPHDRSEEWFPPWAIALQGNIVKRQQEMDSFIEKRKLLPYPFDQGLFFCLAKYVAREIGRKTAEANNVIINEKSCSTLTPSLQP